MWEWEVGGVFEENDEQYENLGGRNIGENDEKDESGENVRGSWSV